VGVGVDSVTIADNRIRVGSIGPVSTGDDGFGIITTYSTSVDKGNLTISGNDFEPLNTSGGRAFFINPGVDAFVFSDNDITGEFTRTAITQAKNGLVKDNVITGTGSSAGLGTLGYPDPTLYGHTEFDCNEITQTVTAINIFATNDVMIRNNTLSNNGTGVRVQDFASLSFDPATIHINSNDISGNTGWGVRNTAAALPEVDAAFNWWGSSSGPSGEGPGTGDAVSVKVDFTPWLLDSVFSGANLIFTDAAGNALVVDQATGAFTFTGADGTFVSGSDAQIAADGTIKIHDQDESEPVNLGEKIDGSGNIETAISVVIKFKNGVKKSFALTLDSLLDVC
jgi:hypothetical protein